MSKPIFSYDGYKKQKIWGKLAYLWIAFKSEINKFHESLKYIIEEIFWTI